MFKHTLRCDPVTIEAPIEAAWRALTAVEDYGEWNSFTISVKTDLKMDSRVDMLVKMGRFTIRQKEIICGLEPPRLLAWRTTIGARFLLHAVRQQRLEALSDNQCRYVTEDAFTGLLTPLVVAFAGRAVEAGFNRVAQGLKQRTEALTSQETAQS